MKVFFSKLFKKIKNYNYRTKLLFVLYFVTLIPVLFLSIYNFNVVKKYIYDKEDAEININLSSIAYNIDSLFITVENLSDVVYLNENLYNMILNAQPSEVGEVYVRYIYPVIRQSETLNRNIKDMSILLNEDIEFISNGKEVQKLTANDKIQDYYKQLYGINSTSKYWDITRNVSGENIISFYRKMDNFGMSDIGVLKIQISEKLIYENCIGSSTHQNYYICDKNNYILSSNDRLSVGTILPTNIINEKRNPVSKDISFKTIDNYLNPGCFIAVQSFTDIVNKEIMSWNLLYLGSVFLILILILFISTKLLMKDVKKIDALAYSLEGVKEGNYSGKVNFVGLDELTQLGKNYDTMLDYLNVLINETYEKNLKIAEYETIQKHTALTMLQNQIRPHFLYNTLDAIRMLAVLNDSEGVENSLIAFANYLKYNVGFGSNEVSLQNEIINAKNYIALINIRREIPIKFIANVSGDILNKQLIRFILQPIVENAIKHGFTRTSKGKIEISCEVKETNFVIVIFNNGSHIQEKILQNINNRLFLGETSENNENIGLLNVNKRIKLKYGNEFGLKMVNSNLGVKANIVLPKDI